MNNYESDWGLSPFEFTLVAMFAAVVFVANLQDNQKTENTHPRVTQQALFGWLQHDFEGIENKTENDAMNKVDSLFQFLEERVGGETVVSPPALSSDQKRFFHQIGQKIKLRKTDHDFSEQEMKKVLRAAAVTYEQIEILAKECGIEDFTMMDWEDEGAQVFFEKMEKKFGVSAQNCKLFAEQMPSSVGDWAFFLETSDRE